MTSYDDDESWWNNVEMEFKRTYTLVDIARKLDRPRTTVKEWSDLFRDYLPTVGSGRTLRYEEPAIEIFAMIAKMKEAGEPNELIREALQQNVREIAVTTVDDEPKPMMMQIAESYTELLAYIRQMDIERRREHDELIEWLNTVEDEQAKLRKENQQMFEALKSDNLEHIEALRAENEHLREQVARLTKALNDNGESYDQRITQVLCEIQAMKEQPKKKRWWQRGN